MFGQNGQNEVSAWFQVDRYSTRGPSMIYHRGYVPHDVIVQTLCNVMRIQVWLSNGTSDGAEQVWRYQT